MKKLVSIAFLCLIAIGVQSQHWKKLNIKQNGALTGSNLNLQPNSKLYMNTYAGFCIFDIISETYDTCYSFSAATFNRGNRYANGKMWIIGPYQVVSINGSIVNSYDTSSALLKSAINDHTVDANGNLWLSTLNGVSMFDGSQFIHDTTVAGRYITADTSGRIYLFEKPFIMSGNSNYDKILIKENGVWTNTTVTGLAPINAGGGVVNAPDFNNVNGQLIYFENSLNGYLKLSYPAQIDTVNLYSPKGAQNFPSIRDLEIDNHNKVWFVSNNYDDRLFSSIDSTCFPHNIYHINNQWTESEIEILDSQVVVRLDCNIYVNKISNKPMHNTIENIDVNSISANVSVKGALFNRENGSGTGFEMPKGSNSQGIYFASIMVSTKNPLTGTFQMNKLSMFEENARIGPVNNTTGLSGNWIVKVSQQDIQNHINNYNSANYQLPNNIAEWPANGDVSLGMSSQLAPYVDINNNGIYEPSLGEYPSIKGDEAIYWINHDNKYEYHGMLYGFDQPNDSALNQSLFLKYEIINHTTSHFDSIKVAMAADFDLGNPSDDYVACDSLKNIFFAYNGDSFDESVRGMNGYGADIPFVGMKFLSDSMDGFVYYNIGTGINGDPYLDSHWHSYLNSRWKNDSPVKYGGDGVSAFGTTNIPTKYMYTNAGGYWSEDDPSNGLFNPNPPGDRRGLGHIPYFSLQPGESKSIDIAVGYALEANGGRLGSKDKLLNYLDSAGRFWASNVLVSVDEQRALQKQGAFKLYPNPAKDRLVIQSELKNERVLFYSLTGRLVKSERLIQERQTFDIADLPSGIYFIRIGNAVEKLVVNK